MQQLNAALSRLSAFAPTILRIALGGLMAYHGFDKFRGGISGVEMFFGEVGVPAAAAFAPTVAVVELVGGIALIAGLGTRLMAAALATVLAGAVLYVKADIGIVATQGPMPGAELDVAILAGLAALLLLGPGRFAADGAIGIEPEPVPAGA